MKKKYCSLLLICLFLLANLSSSGICLAGVSKDDAADVLRFALPAVAYGTTFLKHDTDGRGQFLKAFLTTVGITYILKSTIDHEGPNGHNQSFPSGHTAMAFSGASFLQKRYSWKYGLPAYAAATFVGWSRVDSDDHDTADVMAGAAIAILSSYYFTEDTKENLELQATGDTHSLRLLLLGHW